jgi:hypothetical protein
MSTPAELPPQLVSFIRERITSVEQVSILALFHSSPARAWTVNEISRDLRSTEVSVAKRLDDLYAAGVLAPAKDVPGRHRYFPPSEEMGKQISKLVEAYLSRPNRVIAVIVGHKRG